MSLSSPISEKFTRVTSNAMVAPDVNINRYSHGLAKADEAYDFLKRTQGGEYGIRALKSLRRNVDWHLMPLLYLCYTMTFIDKVLINYAAVMGFNQDLKLKGNDFSNAGSSFFISYLIAEVLYGFILNKVPAARVMAVTIILWGITSACMAAVTDYTTLIVARVFLGLFEGSISPCLSLIVGQWYTKSEQAPRFAIWYSGLGLGQILGGVLSFAFQHVHGGFASWRILFIACGAFTVVLGIGTFLVIPTSPMEARFLSDQEKAALLRHISSNKTGVANYQFKASHLKEMVLDPQIWILAVMTILTSVTSGVISSYSATLISGMGYKPTTAALLNTPSGLVSTIFIILTGWAIRRTGSRWFWIAISCVPGIIGGALMSFLPKSNHVGTLIGIYLVNAVVSTLPNTFGWASANVAGHTKRPVTFALINASYSVGNIIGPQTFQAKDAPEYYPAKITVLVTQAGGALFAMILGGYYYLANKRRAPVADRVAEDSSSDSEERWLNLTDKEHPSFRYMY